MKSFSVRPFTLCVQMSILAAPRKAREDARKALDKAIDAKLAADPEAARIKAQLDEVEKNLDAVRDKLRAAQKG